MLKEKEMSLNLMKQRCALAEKEYKVLKLQEDIKRIEEDMQIQRESIKQLEEEIKQL